MHLTDKNKALKRFRGRSGAALMSVVFVPKKELPGTLNASGTLVTNKMTPMSVSSPHSKYANTEEKTIWLEGKQL